MTVLSNVRQVVDGDQASILSELGCDPAVIDEGDPYTVPARILDPAERLMVIGTRRNRGISGGDPAAGVKAMVEQTR